MQINGTKSAVNYMKNPIEHFSEQENSVDRDG